MSEHGCRTAEGLLDSPDGQLRLAFGLTERGRPFYSLRYGDRPLLLESALGLVLTDAPPLMEGFRVNHVETEESYEEWRPVYGEREQITDHYRSLKVELVQQDEAGRRLVLEFRAYAGGLAFRYVIPEQAGLERFTIEREASQFHLPEGCRAYEEHGAEGEYTQVLIKDMKPDCERPLTVVYPGGYYAALLEAGVDDYPRTLFTVNPEQPWIVETALSGLLTGFVGYGLMDEGLPEEEKSHRAVGKAPFATPWRLALVGENPGQLLERNDLVLNLNAPCRIEDVSWVRPGKLIREMTLSQEGGRRCVDYAACMGLQYVMLDWGWYGDPFDDASLCTRPEGEVWFYSKHSGNHTLSVPELVQYAAERGIGIILYLDRRAVETQIDEFLPVFREWGIAGLKFGFVNTGPQRWTRWLHECIRKCAEYRLFVNVHDAYRTTGYSRTYPNLLTVEGIRGNEHFPTARHNATLPFTRYLAGCGDYTICYFDKRLRTTHAHQLAMSVIAYSPLQSIGWYDVPADAQGEPELEFFRVLPTVWSDTRVLAGEIGELAAIARRREEQWFVGAITNERIRELAVRLDFLQPGVRYLASVYADDLWNTASRTQVSVTVKEVNADTVLLMQLAPSGGQALWLRPMSPEGGG
ncbi:glycoside hydrolase family 97 protein [Paenibacillus sp. YN15]|uniref:glycoside hydrolase family 97 protein n=1 Tax=Paenibacillus sp. YN15 TaxID=1742774 RepID=UPI000DCC40A0|nr:glycoside hydrolase family 97 protein [Paenibacillus sp. YN15]RAV05605.1 alpha-glucosidase [Paenibacillus sp. YN15]